MKLNAQPRLAGVADLSSEFWSPQTFCVHSLITHASTVYFILCLIVFASDHWSYPRVHVCPGLSVARAP